MRTSTWHWFQTSPCRKKIRTFGLLTPSLAEGISNTDMTFQKVYACVIQKLITELRPQVDESHTGAASFPDTDPDEEATASANTAPAGATLETEEDILLRLGAPYEHLMLTL